MTLTREMGEDLGLAFIGRGFDVRVGVPSSCQQKRALLLAEKLREEILAPWNIGT